MDGESYLQDGGTSGPIYCIRNARAPDPNDPDLELELTRPLGTLRIGDTATLICEMFAYNSRSDSFSEVPLIKGRDCRTE